MSILEYNVIDIDFKEDYSLGTDLECHQNDSLILNFRISNYGELVDLTNYQVELRIRRPDGNDYIQTKTGITKGKNGELKIVAEETMTAFSGSAKGELRVWDSSYAQKTGRVIYIKIIPSVLTPNNTPSESTVTILNHLDFSLNKANDTMDKFEESIHEAENEIVSLNSKINEAIQTKNKLDASNTTALGTNTTLQGSISTANERISSLDSKNQTASENIGNLDTKNKTASTNISNLDSKNNTATQNIADLDTRNNKATQNISDLDTRNNKATQNKSNLDVSIDRSIISKKELDTSVEQANTIKPKLDEANELAKESIETIKHLDATNIIQDVSDIKSEIKTARGEFNSLDDRITEAENSGGIYMNQVLPDISERKEKILYFQVLANGYDLHKLYYHDKNGSKQELNFR